MSLVTDIMNALNRLAEWLRLISKLPLQVKTVSLSPPGWIPPAQYLDKVVVSIPFTRPVSHASLKAPGTVGIDLKGTLDGRTVSNVAGTFQFSQDSKSAVFISDQTKTDLIHPRSGETIQYTIKLVGTSAGSGTIHTSSGDILDGDSNGVPGGDYIKIIEVVG